LKKKVNELTFLNNQIQEKIAKHEKTIQSQEEKIKEL
jgi:hypothetical protein